MGIIRKFIGNKLVEAAIKAGHVPAEAPENEEDRLKDLERLKLIEKIFRKINASQVFQNSLQLSLAAVNQQFIY